MIRTSALVATGLIFASAAFAQGNVPQGQSVCGQGYENAKDDGRLRAPNNSEAFKTADKNSDGKLDKAEFDAACANRLFKEQDKSN